MDAISLFEFKTRQAELYRQAERRRLEKLVGKPDQRASRIIGALGRILAYLGQELVSRAQTAH